MGQFASLFVKSIIKWISNSELYSCCQVGYIVSSFQLFYICLRKQNSLIYKLSIHRTFDKIDKFSNGSKAHKFTCHTFEANVLGLNPRVLKFSFKVCNLIRNGSASVMKTLKRSKHEGGSLIGSVVATNSSVCSSNPDGQILFLRKWYYRKFLEMVYLKDWRDSNSISGSCSIRNDHQTFRIFVNIFLFSNRPPEAEACLIQIWYEIFLPIWRLVVV